MVERCLELIERLTERIELLETNYNNLLEEYSKIQTINTIREGISFQKFYENEIIKKAYEKLGDR